MFIQLSPCKANQGGFFITKINQVKNKNCNRKKYRVIEFRRRDIDYN